MVKSVFIYNNNKKIYPRSFAIKIILKYLQNFKFILITLNF